MASNLTGFNHPPCLGLYVPLEARQRLNSKIMDQYTFMTKEEFEQARVDDIQKMDDEERGCRFTIFMFFLFLILLLIFFIKNYVL